jgi:hypothetical protein
MTKRRREQPLDDRSHPASEAATAFNCDFWMRFSATRYSFSRRLRLGHHPRDVGQDARPIHKSRPSPRSRLGHHGSPQKVADEIQSPTLGIDKSPCFLHFQFFDPTGYDFRKGQVVLDAPVITLSSLLARGSHRFGEIFPANVCITIFPFCTMKVSEPSSKRLSAVSAFHTM